VIVEVYSGLVLYLWNPTLFLFSTNFHGKNAKIFMALCNRTQHHNFEALDNILADFKSLFCYIILVKLDCTSFRSEGVTMGNYKHCCPLGSIAVINRLLINVSEDLAGSSFMTEE
jgi:hypothetical protein